MAEYTSSKQNIWMLAALVLIGIIIGFGIAQIPFFKNKNIVPAPATAEEQAQKPTSARPAITRLSAEEQTKLAETDPVLGDATATVTMVEFSDFQCPYCGNYVKNAITYIEENYIKMGKVKLVFRDFPLTSIHQNALPAALAAECANDQGKFWEMHNLLFGDQAAWSSEQKPAAKFKEMAKQIGLNAKDFATCFDASKYNDEVNKDMQDGIAVGIEGTPGTFINGKEVATHCWGLNNYSGKYEWLKISGAMPYETVLKPILEAEVAGKDWALQIDEVCKRDSQVSVKVL